LRCGPVRARVIVVSDSAAERRDLAARSGYFICAYAQACSYQVIAGPPTGPGWAGCPVARWNGDRPRLDEGDREGWQQLTRRLGKRLNLIGYDFFTTNVTRLERGVALRAANGVLVKGEPKRNP
jgi:hypothetical protein